MRSFDFIASKLRIAAPAAIGNSSPQNHSVSLTSHDIYSQHFSCTKSGTFKSSAVILKSKAGSERNVTFAAVVVGWLRPLRQMKMEM